MAKTFFSFADDNTGNNDSILETSQVSVILNEILHMMQLRKRKNAHKLQLFFQKYFSNDAIFVI